MSGSHHAPAAYPALQPGLAKDALAEALIARFGLVRDAADAWDLTLRVSRERLVEVVTALRDDAAWRFDTLLDLAGVDYLSYPGHADARFGIIYGFKSTVFKHRLKLKVLLEEDDAVVPSLHNVYKIADWLEREVFDQYGVTFTGHPNLKRLLNHHEFVGHPLRKDYPCQKRQKLSMNDPLIDQMEARLSALGYTVLDRGEAIIAEGITVKKSAEGSAK